MIFEDVTILKGLSNIYSVLYFHIYCSIGWDSHCFIAEINLYSFHGVANAKGMNLCSCFFVVETM